MGKLKLGNCYYCGKPVLRHDSKRVTIEVGESNGQKVNKIAHLVCHQSQ